MTGNGAPVRSWEVSTRRAPTPFAFAVRAWFSRSVSMALVRVIRLIWAMLGSASSTTGSTSDRQPVKPQREQRPRQRADHEDRDGDAEHADGPRQVIRRSVALLRPRQPQRHAHMCRNDDDPEADGQRKGQARRDEVVRE